MIEDQELKNLFQNECEERILHMKDAINELRVLFDISVLESIFRDAHTIKGTARMFSLVEIEKTAGEIESILDSFRQTKAAPSKKELTDIGKKVAILEELIAREIMEPPETEKESVQSFTPSVDKEKQTESEAPEPGAEDQGSISVTLKSSKEFSSSPLSQLESVSVRVPKSNILELTSHAADLMVTKNKISTVTDGIQSILHTIRGYKEQLSMEWKLREQTHWEEMLDDLENDLSELREKTYEDTFKLNDITSVLVAKIRGLGLVPFSKLFGIFPKMVEEIAAKENKELEFIIEGEEIPVEKKIIEEMKDPIMHIIRNAISHGIESPDVRSKAGKTKQGTIMLKAQQISQTILIEIYDDGYGLDPQKIKKKALNEGVVTEEELAGMSLSDIYSLIFTPGFSTVETVSEISGRGVGLDVLKNHVEMLHGLVHIESQFGYGTKFTIELPTTVLTTRVSIIEVGSDSYALPIEAIESVLLVSVDEVFQVHYQDVYMYNGKPIPIHFLSQLINTDVMEDPSLDFKGLVRGEKIHCLVISIRDREAAIIVDTILDEQEVVLVPHKKLLKNFPIIAGAAILKTGQVCVVIDPLELINGIRPLDSSESKFLKLKKAIASTGRKKTILLVDDSYAIRLYCKRIFEDEGYHVEVAENGVEALKIFDRGGVDAMIADVQMPEMDGITLVKVIRENRKNFVMPIVLMSTMESEEDRKKGLDAGAQFYLGKSAFTQNTLIELVEKLVF